MIAINKLRGAIAEKGFSQAQIADKISITPNTFYRKMREGVFLSNEIEAIQQLLSLNDAEMCSIFFAKDVM